MNTCNFCQDVISDISSFILTDKNSGEETRICRECVYDIFNFFSSGKMETKKLQVNQSQPALLGIKGGKFCELDDNKNIVKIFTNFHIQRAERRNKSQFWQNPQNPSYMAVSPASEITVEAVCVEDINFFP